MEGDEQKPVPIKFVYHRLDPNIVRSMVIFMLAGTAELGLKDVLPRMDVDYGKYLANKAKIEDEFGGAKLAFILKTMLSDFFVNIMKEDLKLANIHSEIVLSMAARAIDHGDENTGVEGPKREASTDVPQ